MPYVSIKERERARWFALNEALNFIEAAESCLLAEAWSQLRAAITDLEVTYKWVSPRRIEEEKPWKPWKPLEAGPTGDARLARSLSQASRARANFWGRASID